MSRVLPSKRRRNPLFYPPNVGSSLDLFCRSSLASPTLFHHSTMPSLKIPTLSLNIKSVMNDPFSHSGLKPLNLSNQSSVRSSTSLKSPNLFNLSSVQFGLNLFCQSSLKPRASSRPSNGGI